MGMKLMPDFEDCLELEKKASPFFDKFYKRRWNVIQIEKVNQKGHDKKITLVDRKSLKIEEKVSSRKYAEKEDILLETISNSNKNSDGWIYYSDADYYAYSWFMGELKKIFLFNMPFLKKWFLEKGHLFEQKKSHTSNLYNTFFILVPFKELEQLCIEGKAEEWRNEKGEWIEWLH